MSRYNGVITSIIISVICLYSSFGRRHYCDSLGMWLCLRYTFSALFVSALHLLIFRLSMSTHPTVRKNVYQYRLNQDERLIQCSPSLWLNIRHFGGHWLVSGMLCEFMTGIFLSCKHCGIFTHPLIFHMYFYYILIFRETKGISDWWHLFLQCMSVCL